MMGTDGRCFPLSNDCADFNQDGVCIGCYKGYSLQNGECIIDEIIFPFDLGCA